MSKPVQQIVDEAIDNFITQRRTAAEIIADVKRNFSLRDEVFVVADRLCASPHPELRTAGKIVETLALNWNEIPTDYLRGTNILISKPCTCADPSVLDRT